MKKKILIIQPFYFYGGHYFQTFNNLINNLSSFNNYEFLVSINNHIKDKVFLNDFKRLNKKNKIHTFDSHQKSDSKINVVKSLIKVINLRKKFDAFFFFDTNIFILSYLLFFLNFFFNNKKLNIYIYYGPEILNKSKVKLFFFKQLLSNKKINIFLRTKELENSCKKKLPNYKKKFRYLNSFDFPSLENFRKKKNKKIFFGSVGQVRDGKSLDFLNSFFKKNYKYNFKIIGGFANQTIKSKFKYLDKKFIRFKNFFSFKEIVRETKKLDYMILLYDDSFDNRNEVSTFFLAAKLKIPVICFKKKSWLSKIVKKYKCGITIKDYSEFKNFPKVNSKKYTLFKKGLQKYEKENFNLLINQKNYYLNLINND